MTNSIKISQLPAAATPLTGAEDVALVQGGVTKQATIAQIAFIASSALFATSTTAVTIGTGSKSFQVEPEKSFFAGQWVAVVAAADTTQYMFGPVVSYSGTTLVVDVSDIGGAGTISSWNISLSGAQGSEGPEGPPGTLSSAGPITITPAAGLSSFFETYDPTPIWSLAPAYTYGIARFNGVNSAAPPTDIFGPASSSPNIVATWGWNFQSGGGRIDITKPAFGFSLEYNYFLNTTTRGWVRGVEGHWKLQNAITGAEHRPISMWLPWDGGSGSVMGLNLDKLVFGKFDATAADALRISYDFNTANNTLITYSVSTKHDYDINNTVIARQRNAAGTDYLNLPYIGATNTLIVSQPTIQISPTLGSTYNSLAFFGCDTAIPDGGVGLLVNNTAAAGANVSPFTANLNSTGTVDLTSRNLGGGNSYLSAWVAVGSGDAATYYNVNGGGQWITGLDNSDSDAFVISVGGALGTGNVLRLDRTTKKAQFEGPVRLKGYTVATLPAGAVGDTAYATDLTTPTYLAAAVGGGAVVGPVFYNGSAWVCG